MSKRGWLLALVLIVLLTSVAAVAYVRLQPQPESQPAPQQSQLQPESQPAPPQSQSQPESQPSQAQLAQQPSGIETLTIIHSTDIHGYLEPETIAVGSQSFESGGMANLVGWIDMWRAADPQHTLVLDSGDIWQGTYISNQSQGEIMIDAMNIAGYNAASPGNHDFDFGQDVLKARIAQATFPFLAANVVQSGSGQTPSWLKPYMIVKVGNIRVGIIGLSYPGSQYIVKPSAITGLTFLPGPESVSKYLDTVRKQSDILLVLSHQGMGDDETLAATVPGIDVIVGGHTHIAQMPPKKVGDTIIVQAGSNAKFIGKLDLTWDWDVKKIINYSKADELVPVVNTKVTPNAKVQALVSAKAAEAAAAMKQPLGETLIPLENCYSGECPLGNLITDAMRAANQAGDRPADIAMYNNGGLRAPLAKGPISYGALFLVMPFGNVLTALDLTGDQVMQILEKSVSGRPGNIVVSGMTFTFDQTRPIGQRVTSATVGGQSLVRTKVYRVETIDYLATGGDGQVTFQEGKNVVYGDPVIDVVAAYIKAHSPVNPAVEGRITGR
jgi:2',3'-cyclic-nucleotide 2'-phosphodiesterase (5'-nucleotidase family)